jgi:ribosomal-protein-alanine N-acetyltransferase
MDIAINWMVRMHFPEVMEIERSSFEHPWTEKELLKTLRNRAMVGMVVEHDFHVVGFYIYQLHKKCHEIVNMAVHPDFRRQGVASAMIAKLTGKVRTSANREGIFALVRDGNLPAHLFFRRHGFRAVKVLHGIYDGSDDDAYRFELKVKHAAHRPPLLCG